MIIDLLANIAYTTILLTFGSTLSVPIEPIGLHGVTTIETRPIASYFSEVRHCRYHGLAVPYERDWEIVNENPITHSRMVNPPAPGKVHDIAVLINKKTCPGKEPERVLLQGTAPDGIWNYGGKGLGWKIMLTSVGKKPDEQPKWFPQVMKVIEEAESQQSSVKEFLDYSRSGVVENQDKAETEASNDELTATAQKATSAPQ